MPEPAGYVLHWPAGGGGTRELFDRSRVAADAIGCKALPLYTADQLRTAIQAVWDAATERAAKQCEELGSDLSRIWRGGGKVDSHLEGQSDGCFDCAAAIRASGGKEGCIVSKEKIGAYIPLYGDDDLPEFIRGHVTVEAAKEAIARWDDRDLKSVTGIQHRWARWVPVRNEDYDRELRLTDERARGTFAITEVVRAAAETAREKGAR